MMLFGFPGISTSGQLIVSVRPRFSFIVVFIMIYLFGLDDSFTIYRFATRTEQLTKYCEPLQKLKARLVPCKPV